MKIDICFDRTFIVVLAISLDQSKNNLTKIHCNKGLPISGYVYDSQADSYYVECHDYITLGYIPVSFQQSMPNVGNWKQKIPMSESVIKRYLTSKQKNELRQFKTNYKNDYIINFMQIIDCF